MSRKISKNTAKTAATPLSKTTRGSGGKTAKTTPSRTTRFTQTAHAPKARPVAGSAATPTVKQTVKSSAKTASQKPVPINRVAPLAKAARGNPAPTKGSRTATIRTKRKATAAVRGGLPAKSAAGARTKSAVRFSDADLDDFRKRLMKLRDDLSGKVAYLRDSSLRRDDEVNPAEDGSDAFDRFFALERAGGVQQRIYAIDEALREIDEGTYGICQSCQSLIRKQRLLALPFARNCIDCQAEQERKRNGQSPVAAPRRFVP
jgi:DnaK suppressor protein